MHVEEGVSMTFNFRDRPTKRDGVAKIEKELDIQFTPEVLEDLRGLRLDTLQYLLSLLKNIKDSNTCCGK
jgi:hypothetical protein